MKQSEYKKTKIVATIGPSSWDYKTLKELALAGMNVVRLNFSHGTHEEKLTQIRYARNISNELGKVLTIFADLQGPKMRLGEIEGKREIKKGEDINLSISPIGDELPIQFDLSNFIKKNQRIYLNDGLIELRVSSVSGKVIRTIAQNSGWVSSHKGINIPDTTVSEGVFTQKDHEDAEFAISAGVDYLALSFVQNAQDLKPAQKLISKLKAKTKIIAKIETMEATKNLEEIIKNADALMVARGDLAIEIKAAEVPIVQQKIIRLARQYNKPVIVATQMLESMVENPRPTRAEVSDVANAVIDQADCVMLSAETANGKYPVETVKVMNEIIQTVEQNPEYKESISIDWDKILGENVVFSAIAESGASLAGRLNAKALVVSTTSGRTAKLLSSFRPQSRIITFAYDDTTRNQLNLVWGITPFTTNPTSNFNGFLKKIISLISEKGVVRKGDKVVLITGEARGTTGLTDTIKLVTI